ncbi:hypothetical protein PUN28_012915 [Cardiocondyla obscurior]|uniref:Uncharacterized protein n=1 Tax=Cardiocondyla obscurior TaxID=286306 RepID=A0AAW2FAX7_9HYME
MMMMLVRQLGLIGTARYRIMMMVMMMIMMMMIVIVMGTSGSDGGSGVLMIRIPLLLVVAGVGVNVGESVDISGVTGVFLSSFFSTLPEVTMFLGLFAKTSFEDSVPSSFIGCPGERRRRT